jgi:PBP1b-binding outer membrane lipoprotein LpoB
MAFIQAVSLILGSLIIMTGCEQEDDLVAITSFVTIEPSITATGFETGGRLAANRKIEFLEYGVVYSTSVNPTTENDIISPGTDLIVSDNRNRFSAEFKSPLTLLNPGTTYYIKAFVSTRSGTAYGNQISFTVN